LLDTDHTPADTPRELGKRGPGAAGDVIDRLAGTEIEQVDRGDTQSPDRAIRGVVTAARDRSFSRAAPSSGASRSLQIRRCIACCSSLSRGRRGARA